LREVAVDRQNITLALPKDVLKRLKIMAAERGSSMSAMMEELLQDHLARHEGYAEARRRQSTLLAARHGDQRQGELEPRTTP
jgi:plasmid stability protein